MLCRVEESGFPIVWHVGDPPEFWNPETVPLWAKQRGWSYDQIHPTKHQIDHEIAQVLGRYPQLNLDLPHFSFVSDQLEKANELLEAHPRLYLDLAPGVKMYHNFTRDPDAARTFFVRNQDRILYRSDAGMMDLATSIRRSWMIQHWLDSDDCFEVPDDPLLTPNQRPALTGIAFPTEVLEKIYTKNVHQFIGRDKPVRLDLSLAQSTLEQRAQDAIQRAEHENTPARVLRECNR